MRKLIVIAFLLVVGCGQPMEQGFYNELLTWQERESKCEGFSGELNDGPVYFETINTEIWNTWNIIGDKSEPNYESFNTSCEVMERGHGDCTDFAVVLYSKLRAHGFPDSRMWIVGLKDMKHDVLLIDMTDYVIIAESGVMSDDGKAFVLDEWPRYKWAINLIEIK